MSADRYGSHFFTVMTDKKENFSLCADSMEISPSGAFVLWGGWRERHESKSANPVIVFTLAPGGWTAAFAHSGVTGQAVAIFTDK